MQKFSGTAARVSSIISRTIRARLSGLPPYLSWRILLFQVFSHVSWIHADSLWRQVRKEGLPLETETVLLFESESENVTKAR